MIMHTTVPDELLYAGIENVVAPEEMFVQGILMQVERVSNTEVKVIRIISPELSHYLKDAYVPGRIITI